MAPTQQDTTTLCAGDNSTNGTSSRVTTNSTFTSKKSKESASNSTSNSYNSSNSNSFNNNNKSNNIANIMSITDLDNLLPVNNRGLFYQDSFFKEARQHYDTAMREVLDNCGRRSALEDDLTTYRKLRESHLTEDSRAATVTEHDTHHQVVLDVKDFEKGEVKVKVVDENEVVVEGSVEQVEGSSTSTKRFRRSFTFPGKVRSEVITATTSSDGVLTVTVPKKVREEGEKDVNVTRVDTTDKLSPNEANIKVSKHSTSSITDTNISSFKGSRTEQKEERQKEKKVQFKEVNGVNTSSGSSSENLMASTSEKDSTTLAPNFTVLLPITSKGQFFHDSFFVQARQDYETAVRRVLETWGETADSDFMARYRTLRERDLKEENQAVSVSEDQKSHKVVLDVRDFEKGEVKVKVVDENEVVVEGSVEQVKGSSTSTKRFRRSFTFPGQVRSEVITATTSSDGVLTVTIPKKDSSHKLQGANENCTSKNTTNMESSTKESTAANKNSTNTTQCSFTTSGDSIKVTDTQDSRCQSSSRSSVFSDHLSQARALEDDLLSSTATVGSEPSWTLDSLLPVDHRGLFFHDSFFQDAHQHFESAVNEVLTKFGRSESSDDDLSVYRSLRQRDLRDENQAVKVTENHHSHQVVMDVRDFMKGDVKVKMVGEKEVEVEGVVEECEGDSKSCRSFRRRFHLPGLVEVDAVTSALSSDGVLTITAPKVART